MKRRVRIPTKSRPGVLDQWVIYERPSDFPTKYVARRWEISVGTYAPTDQRIVKDTLEEVRQSIPFGLVRLMRHPSDDPCIVEVWL